MRRRLTVLLAAAGAAMTLGAAPAWALDGDLDTTFDGDGKATGTGVHATAGARQSTGKLLVAGSDYDKLKVARRTATGGPDTTWGGDGLVEVTVPGLQKVVALGVQSDDKVVAFGGGPNGQALIVRLTSGGLPDGTYDGDGLRVTTLPDNAYVNDGVLDSSGRAVVAAQGATYPYKIVLARHTTTGAPDSTFSNDGFAEDPYAPWSTPFSIAAASGGRVVISGYHAYGRGFAARYTDAGAPDPAFGSGGHLDFPQTGSGSDIAVDSSGRTLVSMLYGGTATVLRLTAGGQIDGTWNGGSPAAVPGFENSGGMNGALAVQPDGKAIVGGRDSGQSSFRVARLTAAGAPDATWGANGAVLTPFSSLPIVADLVVQPDKRVVALGSGGEGFAIARYKGGPVSDTIKPTVRITPPATTTGAVTFAFNEDVRGITAANTVLRVTGQTANVPGTLSCKDSGGARVRCDGSVRTALLTPAAALTPGQAYAATANPAGAPSTIKDVAGNVLAATSAPFRADLSIGDADAAIAYEWAPVTASQALGGSYRQEITPGATMSLTYTGSSATAYVVKGPKFGIAKVTIDNGAPIDVDLYAPDTRYGQPLPLMLGQGAHTIRMEVSGRKNAASAGYAVNLDGFKVGDGSVQPDPTARQQWKAFTAAAADAGRYVTSSQGGSRATMRFRGTSVQWRTLTGPGQGQARVFIDGVQRGSVIDNYAASAAYVSRTFAGLSDGVHTIRVVPNGTKGASATGFGVAVDSFLVG